MDQPNTTPQTQHSAKPAPVLRDPAGFDISAHIKITDLSDNRVLVDQRG